MCSWFLFLHPALQRGKPGSGVAENKFTDAQHGAKGNPSVNGEAMDIAVSPAGGAGRSADRNGDEGRRYDDAGVGVGTHTGGAASHGGWT